MAFCRHGSNAIQSRAFTMKSKLVDNSAVVSGVEKSSNLCCWLLYMRCFLFVGSYLVGGCTVLSSVTVRFAVAESCETTPQRENSQQKRYLTPDTTDNSDNETRSSVVSPFPTSSKTKAMGQYRLETTSRPQPWEYQLQCRVKNPAPTRAQSWRIRL